MARFIGFLFIVTTLFVTTTPAEVATNSKKITKREVQRVIGTIRDHMVTLRGLPATGPYRPRAFKHKLTSKSQLNKYLQQQFAQQYNAKELEWEERFVKMLGMLPAQLNYEEAVIAFLVTEAGGYYDPYKRTLYVADWIATHLQRPVLAHEIVHALQDAHFNLKPWLKRDSHNDDRRLAWQALLEGDATYSMYLYEIQQAGLQLKDLDQAQWQNLHKQILALNQHSYVTAAEHHATAKVPYLIREMSYFPYRDGLRFVIALTAKQPGFKAINNAFKRLPASSEQILYPDKYMHNQDAPVEIDLQPLRDRLQQLKPPWQLKSHNLLGVQGCRLLLGRLLAQPTVQQACDHWQGDRYAIFEQQSTQATVLIVMHSLWDSIDDAREFAAAMRTYLAGTPRLQTEQSSAIKQQGRTVLFLTVSPKMELAPILRAALASADLP